MSLCERKKELAKEVFSVDIKDNVAYIEVKDKSIKEVGEECLKGLLLIMKDCGKVSLHECFRDCGNISALNFSSTFSTRIAMFCGCISLSPIDLSTFKTSKVVDMSHMFYGCSSLSSLNLSTFNTSNVRDMSFMFWGCSNLSSLNLSTFDTSNITNMSDMFRGVVVSDHLIYLHLIQVMLQI